MRQKRFPTKAFKQSTKLHHTALTTGFKGNVYVTVMQNVLLKSKINYTLSDPNLRDAATLQIGKLREVFENDALPLENTCLQKLAPNTSKTDMSSRDTINTVTPYTATCYNYRYILH